MRQLGCPSYPAHLFHEVRRLSGQPLIDGRKLRPQPADHGRLMLGLRLRRTQSGLERDPGLLQARVRPGLGLERCECRLETGNLAGLVLGLGPQLAQLPFGGGAVIRLSGSGARRI